MSEVDTEKKYKLNRKEPGKSQPCAFLKRPEGCRNGEKCPFSHGTGEPDGYKCNERWLKLVMSVFFKVEKMYLSM